MQCMQTVWLDTAFDMLLFLSFSSFLKYVDVFGVGQIKGKGKAGRSLI